MKVLLLHAWPLDESMREPQTAALLTPGTRSRRRASTAGIVRRRLGGADTADFDGPLVAVGASMGGWFALALARRAPERILGLVLAGSRAGAESFEGRRAREERISELRERASQPLIYGRSLPTSSRRHRRRCGTGSI